MHCKNVEHPDFDKIDTNVWTNRTAAELTCLCIHCLQNEKHLRECDKMHSHEIQSNQKLFSVMRYKEIVK